MYGFEHFGAGWGMVLVWLIPILLTALVVRYGFGDRGGKPDQRRWTPWNLAMSKARSIGKSF